MRLAKVISPLALLQPASGAPRRCRASTCKDPPVRREWRQLTTKEKAEYIEAIQCLTNLNAKSGLQGAEDRFDDFQAVHSNQTQSIHWVHRYFVASYEKSLREKYGYTGAQPYWDWPQDASTEEASTAIFEVEITDPADNPLNLTGRTGGGCVQDDPFTSVKFQLHHAGGGSLKRDFIPWIMNSFAQQSLVDHVQNQPDYTSFTRALENVPDFT